MRLAGTVLFLLLGAQATDAASISITVTGTLFDGGPAFFVEAGDFPVGTGIVTTPELPLIYSFSIPDDALSAAPFIRVHFLNDKYQAGMGDRNLLVMAISVNGTVFSRGELVTSITEGRVGTSGRLNVGTAQVRVDQPPSGWPVR